MLRICHQTPGLQHPNLIQPAATCLCESLFPLLRACPPIAAGLTGEAAVVRLAAALGAGTRVISLDLLLLAGHNLRFGPPSWEGRD